MILFIIVFIFILFLYVHIYHHIKTSNELEVYDIKCTTREKLDEICDIRQPVTFQYDKGLLTYNIEELCDKYPLFDIYISRKVDNKETLAIPLPLQQSIELMYAKKEDKYTSENNEEFLKETGLIKELKMRDLFLRPYLVTRCNYDLIFGNVASFTKLKYNLEYRKFYYVQTGKVKLKLIAPSYSKYLSQINDYEKLEFSSPINPWDVQEEYGIDYGRVKVLEVTLHKGDIIYIPAYWWWSMQFEELSIVNTCAYMTSANVLAVSHLFFISFLQRSNVKHIVLKNSVKNNLETTSDKE
jgi:hypothetical protein